MFIYVFLVYACSKRHMCRSQFSPSTMWLPGSNSGFQTQWLSPIPVEQSVPLCVVFSKKQSPAQAGLELTLWPRLVSRLWYSFSVRPPGAEIPGLSYHRSQGRPLKGQVRPRDWLWMFRLDFHESGEHRQGSEWTRESKCVRQMCAGAHLAWRPAAGILIEFYNKLVKFKTNTVKILIIKY